MSKSKCKKHTRCGPLLEVESARRRGAKHIWRSKCAKHASSGPLLEVEISKKCTPLWREAHFEVNMLKTLGVRTTFGSSDVEKVHAVVARNTFWSQKCKKTDVYGTLLDVWRSLAEVLRLWCCQLWQMRKSRRIASFLMWSSSKNEEVSQNCFVFDVVNFKNWGSLAEVLRFWCCQLEKMKMSRRIARFSSLQIDRQTDRQTERER